jgi:hypothetical protein
MSELVLISEKAAAQHIGMSVAFLRDGRCRGVLGGGTPPPPHLKLGRSVRYAKSDLDEWLDARRVKRLPAAGASAARRPLDRRP